MVLLACVLCVGGRVDVGNGGGSFGWFLVGSSEHAGQAKLTASQLLQFFFAAHLCAHPVMPLLFGAPLLGVSVPSDVHSSLESFDDMY